MNLLICLKLIYFLKLDMNNRLKELYTEVVGRDKLAFDSYLAEKFAELIVRECIEISQVGSITEEKIKQHFGVEE